MISFTLFILLIIAVLAYLRQRDRADDAEFRLSQLIGRHQACVSDLTRLSAVIKELRK